MEPRKATSQVGYKFNEDASVSTFPGNTIISMIDPASRVYEQLLEARDLLGEMPAADKYVFMPPSSYHMTVIEGVCDQVRLAEKWTRFLPLDAPLEEVDRLFTERFRTITVPDSFTMAYHYISPLGIRLLPASDADRDSLRSFRDDVSEKLGLRFPNHDHYEFHITLAYNLFELTEEEATAQNRYIKQHNDKLKGRFADFATTPPKLVFFEHMFQFNETREA